MSQQHTLNSLRELKLEGRRRRWNGNTPTHLCRINPLMIDWRNWSTRNG